MISAEKRRVKLWHEGMQPSGSKHGPGLWAHPKCAEEFFGVAAAVAESIETPIDEPLQLPFE